jgi:hypothetical protein
LLMFIPLRQARSSSMHVSFCSQPSILLLSTATVYRSHCLNCKNFGSCGGRPGRGGDGPTRPSTYKPNCTNANEPSVAQGVLNSNKTHQQNCPGHVAQRTWPQSSLPLPDQGEQITEHLIMTVPVHPIMARPPAQCPRRLHRIAAHHRSTKTSWLLT